MVLSRQALGRRHRHAQARAAIVSGVRGDSAAWVAPGAEGQGGVTDHVYRGGFFFCGCGGGAFGTLRARIKMLGHSARFVSVGGLDNCPLSCADFEMLTESSALCCDIRECTPSMLRALMGDDAPDMVVGSPPCQGYSRLISKKLAQSPKYRELNRLVLVWIELVLATWPDDPPALLLLENVEGIQTRGADLLAKVRKLLKGAGYLLSESTHDAGEIGGLAQHRSRYLMVARLPKRVPALLYQPPKKRVRGCGEVLGDLPVPGGDEGGPMHALPLMIPVNWLRLALIPAGGDWRDLKGVLADGQARRDVFGRFKINAWDEACATVAGSGTNGVYGVADPRVKVAYDRGYGVLRWDQPSPTVAGGSAVGQGAYAVADPRFTCEMRAGAYGVLDWKNPAKTITGHHKVDNAPAAVADPRVKSVELETVDWSSTRPMKTPPVMVAPDGTWHRPLTILDLAALQGLPTLHRGQPLKLAGNTLGRWRTAIGNVIPPGAAEAIAEKQLVSLLASDLGSFSMSSDAVWVESPEAIEPGMTVLQ